MYCSIVSAIASSSSSSEYSWSECRLKSGDLNSSRLRVLKCLLDDQSSRSDDQYVISNGSGYAVLIYWDEYAVLDRNWIRRIQLSTRTVILKQIPAFNFFCASLESISAIENTWEWCGIANMALIQLGGNSRVVEMILARVSSGLRVEKVWTASML
ncbi:hypothetical protein Tco_0260407 [Tanacetum coccineum]